MGALKFREVKWLARDPIASVFWFYISHPPTLTYTHSLLLLLSLALPESRRSAPPALTPGRMPSPCPLTWMPPERPLVSPSAGWSDSADPSRGEQSSAGRRCSPVQRAGSCLSGVEKVRKDGCENTSTQCPSDPPFTPKTQGLWDPSFITIKSHQA